MRCIVDADTAQIEITNACHLACSNCTRLVGHIKKPFMMTFDCFKNAIDSMKGYPKMTGIMGGEPLLHPLFEEFCDYAASVIPREQLGLWSSFPEGKEHHRGIICKTFGNVFLNDHSRDDIYHAPILVGAEEVIKDEQEMLLVVDHCWLQNAWSSSINPKGAFFCEVAASMAMLFDEPDDQAWPVEPRWWMRIPAQYREQMDKWCRRCGVALSIGRRGSKEEVDDISPKNLERLKGKSKRVAKGHYKVHDLVQIENPQPMFQYKEQWFREKVARRYGIFLTINAKDFSEPHLLNQWKKEADKPTLFQIVKEQYG